ncbi:Mannose-6-phosphate receptor binding protein [Macrophomina phaseolina MS6]|uniref:Endoplasmic reticulum lectin n=1 Tax=Macrophomina phaseolina (strain MS6) TaxID=1126212 RepID=K2RG75_MACPH|nr:Mannose-6-phosphate receptor binding protein [Macrophomina phaseolina MS6]
MTKQFWALSLLVQLVLASQSSFSVLDDLLAFPQYQVVFADTPISEDHAKSLREADPADATQTTVDLSHHTRAGLDDSDDSSRDDGSAVPNPFASSRDHPDEDELAAVYERMILHTQPYLCRIPIVDTNSNKGNTSGTNHSKADEEKELMRASDRGWELLKGMQGNCIYFISGWWSYSFCYNDSVKQFHQLPPGRGVPMYPPVEDETVQSYILGTFPKEDDKKKTGAKKVDGGRDESAGVDDEGMLTNDRGETSVARLETKGETRYLVQKLTGGTTCDLTGKERKIEVQFHCHPNTPDRIGLIKEVATCSYLMVIYTPRLCNDVAFLPPQENRAHAISCAPIAASDDDLTALPSAPARHKWRPKGAVARTKAGSAETDIELPDVLKQHAANYHDATQATSTPLPTIGGVVVGAKQLVGKPGSVIEKSVVVGGGKETLLGVVASSEGGGRPEKAMNAEELKRLEIDDKREVEKLRRQLSKLAGRKPWRLEFVDTPRGREFRGIIEQDEGEDVDEKKQKGNEKEEKKKEEEEEEEGGDAHAGTGGDGMQEEDEGDWGDAYEWEWWDPEEGQWQDFGGEGNDGVWGEGAEEDFGDYEGGDEVYHEEL